MKCSWDIIRSDTYAKRVLASCSGELISWLLLIDSQCLHFLFSAQRVHNLFFLDQKPAHLAGAHSSMRVSFIRFTSDRQNKGVWDGYMGVLCSHQRSALPFQVDRTDVHPVAKTWS